MSIYESAVRKPITTILIFIGVIIFGLYSLTRLSIDLLPDFEVNQLTVMCSYPGASASDIETNVTRLLEDGLNTVDDLKKISSRSKENFSLITLEFEWGTDLDIATNDVRDKLELLKTSLPEGSMTPNIFRFSTNMIPVMQLSVRAKESLPALYKILEERVANPLNRIDGIASVSISGAPERVVQVNLDPIKLEAYHLTIESIGQKIAAENLNMPGGTFDIGSETYSLRIEGEFKQSSEINNIVVGAQAGKLIYLRDVAEVVDTVQDRIQESYTNGIQGATIAILKQSGSNTVEIAKSIKKALPEITKNLPPDVNVEILIDSSDSINNSINSLIETVLYAFLFVMLVVYVFLGRWRATFIIIITIPVSLIVSFIYLMVAGESLNIITLSSLSIAIGMVVDDAIVVLENITTHIERGSPPKQAAVYATNEVGVAVIATTLTVMAVFFPLTMVEGMAGIMFKPLGWMVTIIIGFSTLTALTLTPMLSSQMLRLNPKESKLFTILYTPILRGLDAIDRFYERSLRFVLHHRGWTVTICALIFISSLGLFSRVKTEFFPQSDNAKATGMIRLPVGTRTEISKELAKSLTDLWVTKYPELKQVNYNIGIPSDDNTFAILGTNGTHIISLNLSFASVMERERSMFAILDSMRADIETKYPEIERYELTAGGGKGGGMGGASTVDVEIFGYDFDQTNKLAKTIQDSIKAYVVGAVDVNLSREDFTPEYHVDFDREKLALNGLSQSTASQYVRNRMNGLNASFFREDGEEYDIVVRYDKKYRESLEQIENIMIYNNQGKGVALRDVAQVVERFGPPTIEREDRQRVIKVQTTVSGAAMSDVVLGIQKEIDKLEIPGDIGIQLGGSFEDQQESFADILLLLILVVILVYIVMASQFESFSGPFIILLSLPFAFTGVFFALYITNTTLSMTSLIGAVMLVGIVVKNGIVLVDYINLNRERGMKSYYAIVDGGKSRLRPVLMTTLTTILGMFPMALGIGEGAEMWAPMGIAIMGGLTFSTVLTLVVVPVVYSLFAAREDKKKRQKADSLVDELVQIEVKSK